MLLILGLALAMGAAAEDSVNFKAREFWSHQYHFEQSYHRLKASITVGDEGLGRLEKIFQDIDAKKVGDGRASNPAGVISEWLVPSRELPAVQAALAILGRLEKVSTSDEPAPDASALYYKQRHLREEEQRILPAAHELPSIMKLLEAQLKTVDERIGLYENAMNTTLVTLTTDATGLENSRVDGPRGTLIRRRKQRAWVSAQPAFWSRKSADLGCPWPERFMATVRVAPGSVGSGRARVTAFLRRVQAPDLRCVGQLEPDLYLARRDDAFEFRRMLAGLGELASWTSSQPALTVDGGRKWELLRKDLTDHPRALDPVPHIAALVDAEVARLEPAAAAQAALEPFILVHVAFAEEQSLNKPDSSQ
jgi:hypothetical protein